MPYTCPTVNYSNTINGTYTSLTGIQSVSINRGRQRIADPFPQSSCVVELIPANSYATALAIGQYIDVRPTNSSSDLAFFAGRITDVERIYDMPYNAATGAAPGDRIRITCTGGTGILATQYSTYTWGAVSFTIAVGAVQTASNVRIQADASSLSVSAQSIYGGGLDVLNVLANTTQKFMDDSDKKRNNDGYVGEIFLYGVSPNTITFSDTGVGYKMRRIQFLSTAQNTFSQVNVSAAGLATQTASSGTPPYNTLNEATYAATTADALALAGYLYNVNSGQLVAAPAVIGTDTTVADTCTDIVKLCTSGPTYGYIGSPVTVTFRGTTSYAQVQGISAAFYPDKAEVQVYLSPSIGTAFTLNSTQFGILNTNRLGYP